MAQTGIIYSRSATARQQSRRPRKKSSCFYDASKEIEITRNDLLRARRLAVGRRISVSQSEIKDPTARQLEEIYEASDKRVTKALQNDPIKPNSFLEDMLGKIKNVYYRPGQYRELFQLRKKRGGTKSGRLPRGERLEVMTVISMYLTLTIDFAHDTKCLAKYGNFEYSPTVGHIADVLGFFGYSERRVREAYTDLVKTGIVSQIFKFKKEGHDIRSRPSDKIFNDSFYEIIGGKSLLKSIRQVAKRAWELATRKKSEGKLYEQSSMDSFLRKAQQFEKKPNDKFKSKTLSNKAPPEKPSSGRAERPQQIQELLDILNKGNLKRK